MTFGIGRSIGELVTTIAQAQQAITAALDRSFAGMRSTVEATMTAAQNARDAAVGAQARADAIHSELQGIRNDTQRLQPAAPPHPHRDQQILTQLTELRTTVEGLRADLTAAKAPETATNPVTKEQQQRPSEPDDFDDFLTLAAGIAYAQIICHRDHWDFLVGQSSRGQHFRLPAGVKEANGLIQAEISGRALIAVLDALRTTQQDLAATPGTQQLAREIYARIGIALRNVDTDKSSAHYQSGKECPPVTRIIIDDRPPAADAA
ncbi:MULTISPECIES: hypothetical protein [unclassified Streptomyces]|uniref:hypothetical protein n=1 Tax=unclassified Streptomyces TaxID=2593676 RepID=UPI00055DC457|nr:MULTISPECIES: hypothetical protein [unclassified Streptomyces]MYT34117.1 hypothetical protein [Streptomyces sp. SID8354]